MSKNTGFTRRQVLKTSGAMAITAVVPLLSNCGSSSSDRVAGGGNGGGSMGPTQPSTYLSESQLDNLRALVDRLIPEDMDPGAVAGCCAEAIDHLLAAFKTDPPFIFAGAPFSDRGGEAENGFLEFIPLDPYEELAWRMAIEGSQGMPEREFNGPVKGMQQIYIEGLARLDERAAEQGFGSFSEMPASLADVILGDSSDAAIQDMVDIAFPDTLDAMYGPPEYGGNCALVGWGFTAFDGDVHPRGYTDEQVVTPDNPGLFDALLPPSFGPDRSSPTAGSVTSSSSSSLTELPMLASVVSSDTIAAAIMDSNGSLKRLQAQLKPMAQQRIATLSNRVYKGVSNA